MPSSGEERLALLERRVAAQRTALEGVPFDFTLPAHVVALLAVVPAELDGVEVPGRCQPRLVKLHADLQAIIANLELRRAGLTGRIATVRSARRAGEVPHRLDWTG
ncbi:MAG TPA: hypothetical protein VME20_02870 [Acidimicrobiales bacterium]|nr:hypothetical protein [Acidimicrobiales bacterium]